MNLKYWNLKRRIFYIWQSGLLQELSAKQFCIEGEIIPLFTIVVTLYLIDKSILVFSFTH